MDRLPRPGELPRLERGPVVLRAFTDRDADLVVSVADDPLIPLVTTGADRRHPGGRTGLRRPPAPATGERRRLLVRDRGRRHRRGGRADRLWTRELEQGRASTGYWIAPAHRARGYATAALGCLTAWALTRAEVERVELHVEPANEASWRAAERCGYEREGLLRSWLPLGDERRAVYVYSVVR